jgi:hypothetical protein
MDCRNGLCATLCVLLCRTACNHANGYIAGTDHECSERLLNFI